MALSNSVLKGKRNEYNVIARLLAMGKDAYLPVADDKGIDCIIKGNNGRYLDIQMKARSHDECILKDRGFFANLKINDPRDNYYFIFYSAKDDMSGIYWVIPSKDIIEIARMRSNICKLAKGTYNVRLANEKFDPYSNFEKYQDGKGFALINAFLGEDV